MPGTVVWRTCILAAHSTLGKHKPQPASDQEHRGVTGGVLRWGTECHCAATNNLAGHGRIDGEGERQAKGW
jgi:hypothetical protein